MLLKALINLWSTDFNSNSSRLINRGKNSENVVGSRWAPLIVSVRRREGKLCISLPGGRDEEVVVIRGGESAAGRLR